MKTKMKIKHVTIEIEDNWRYCLVAWLMDRDDFLADLYNARKELGIDDELIKYTTAQEWLKAEFAKQREKTPIKKAYDQAMGKNRYVFPKTKSAELTAKLLTKYHKPSLYFDAVRHAIITGVVTDKEFARTAFCQILPPDYQISDTEHDITNFVDHDQPVMAIVISPETTLKEVMEVFKEEVPYLRDEYVSAHLKNKPSSLDVISNIKRDRKWYWMHKQGLSYKIIFNKEVIRERTYRVDGIIKAIKRYQRKLTVNN